MGFANAQKNLIEGILISEIDAKPIPFGTISETRTFRGTQCDSAGRFTFQLSSATETLEAKVMGYDKLKIIASENSFVVFRMKPNDFYMSEITVKPIENSAWKLMRKVLENKDINDPTSFEQFRSDYYSKVTMPMDIVSGYNKGKDNPNGILFISENIGTYFQKKNINKIIIDKSISSFPKNYPVDALLNYSQNPFGFYAPKITINLQLFLNTESSQTLASTRSYINPINKNTFEQYELSLGDTLKNNLDSTFTINFSPKKTSELNGFEGFLKINSRNFALEEVNAKTYDSTGLFSIVINQKYEKIADIFYPKKLDLRLKLPISSKKVNGNIEYKMESYYDKIVNSNFDSKYIFDGSQRQVLPMSDTISRLDFSKFRPIALDSSEIAIYKKALKVDTNTLFKSFINPAMKLFPILMSGAITVGKTNILLNQFLLNNYEKVRVGVGLQNSQISNPRFRVFGSIGYGIFDKKFKYNTQLAYHITRDRYNKVELFASEDLQRPGQNPTLYANYNLPIPTNLNIGIGSYLLDKTKIYGAAIFLRPFSDFQIKIYGQNELRKTLNYAIGESQSTTTDYNQFGLSLRYARKEIINRIGNIDIVSNPYFPVIRFNATKYSNNNGIKNEFFKTNLMLIQQLRFSRIGKTNISLSAGKGWGNIPFQYVFNNLSLPQTLSGNFGFEGSTTLSTVGLGYKEYLSLGIFHDFEKHLLRFKNKNFQPQIIIGHRMEFGNLLGTKYLVDNKEIIDFRKGNYELRLQIRNLAIIKIYGFKIGLGFLASNNFSQNAYVRKNWTFWPTITPVLF